MIGDRLYVFYCGCISYTVPKLIGGGRVVCKEHNAGIKVVHRFCKECGLDMECTPRAAKKAYCDYPSRVKNKRTGKYSIVNGCAGIRIQERNYSEFRKKAKLIPKTVKCDKPVVEGIISGPERIKQILSRFDPPPLPKTPLLDELLKKLKAKKQVRDIFKKTEVA